MRAWRRSPFGLAAILLLVAGCVDTAPATPGPSGGSPGDAPSAIPAATERPFATAAWPAGGSACDIPGYAGRLGRIEAVSARSVRFTLCAPDGAFPARLAHPALGVIDAAEVDLVAADPAAARTVPGAGAFRVDAWAGGEEVRLARVADATTAASPGPSPAGTASGSPDGSGAPAAPPPVIVLRWAASPVDRAAALLAASVDGMDAPGATELADMATLPEVAVLPRAGMGTAYLGFGTGRTFSRVGVRRAFAQALDHAALARDAFPAGSAAATFLTPCEVPAGCAGTPWYDFNGPAAAAALDAAGFDTKPVIALHVPDAPVPGLPDPAAAGAAVRDQLAASIGVTVVVDAMPVAELDAAVADGTLGGLYLGGVASSLADPSGFLEPLFGEGATGSAAVRAKGVTAALGAAAPATADTDRQAAFAAANNALRSAAPIVPLVHAGSTAAYRSDVTGVEVSPLGIDPLGAFVPGDRRQLVIAGADEPPGAWCAVASTPDALRLCGLVTPGLYAFAGASLDPVPALASRCTPSADATVWTCRLRADLAFSDGRRVDAGDVLASLRAQGDAGSALRAALPGSAFAAWDELFGGPVPASAP